MTRKSRLTTLAVLLGCGLLVLLLPALLSTRLGTGLLLALVNSRLPGTVEVDDLAVGWLQGPELIGIHYADPDRDLRVSVARINGTQGLLPQLVVRKNLGTITIDAPVLDLGGAGDGAEQVVVGESTDSAPPAKDGNHETLEAAFWEGMVLDMVVRDGRIQARGEGTTGTPLLQGFAATFKLRDGALGYTVSMESGQGGQLHGEGNINLPTHSAAFLDTLVAKGTVELTALNGSPLLDICAQGGVIPTGGVVADGTLDYKVAGIRDIRLAGGLTFSDIALQGGFLKTDTPQLNTVSLALDVRRQGNGGWTIKQVKVTSDPLKAELSGQYGGVNGDLRLTAELDLPELARQIPASLGLREGTRVFGGKLSLDSDLSLERGLVEAVDVRAQMQQVAGSVQGKSFIWSDPVAIQLAVTRGEKGPQVDAFTLSSAFVNLSGKGHPASFALEGAADLAAMSGELGQIFVLPWQATGELALTATTQETTAGNYQLSLQSNIEGFSLAHGGETLLPQQRLTTNAKASFPLTVFKDGGLDLQLTTATSGATIAFNGRQLHWQKGKGAGQFDLTTDFSLAYLQTLCKGFGIAPILRSASGQGGLALGGHLVGSQIRLHQFDVRFDEAKVNIGGAEYRDRRVRLAINGLPEQRVQPVQVRDLVAVDQGLTDWNGWEGTTGVDLQRHSLQIHNLAISSSAMQVDSCSLAVADWQDWQSTLRLDSDLTTNLAVLTTFLQGTGRLDKEVELAGELQAALHLGHKDGRPLTELAATLPALTVRRQGRDLLVDEAIQMEIVHQGKEVGQPGDIRFSLKGRPLAIKAEGSLLRGEQGYLELNGTMTPDLQRLAALIQAATGKEVAMQGKTTQPFALYLPLPIADRFAKLRVDTRTQAERVAYQGIDFTTLDLPVKMDNGLLHLAVSSGLNGGTLAVKTDCNLKEAPPLLTIPDKSQVLKDVQLVGPLVSDLLSRLHPLFGALTKPSGTISATVDAFSWPMVEAGSNQATFTSTIDISQVNLANTGVLKEVLTLLNLGEERLQLKDSSVTCNGANGRITCTPVRILVAESEMTVSGSVGLDRSIDYLLEIPVTKKLVGEEGYRVLKDTTINVPIKGTLGQPLFNRKVIESTLGDLLKQAAGNTLQKQVDKLIPDLFHGLLGE